MWTGIALWYHIPYNRPIPPCNENAINLCWEIDRCFFFLYLFLHHFPGILRWDTPPAKANFIIIYFSLFSLTNSYSIWLYKVYVFKIIHFSSTVRYITITSVSVCCISMQNRGKCISSSQTIVQMQIKPIEWMQFCVCVRVCMCAVPLY